jgi:hypothetical protein|tara:strand:- start:1632 stop:1802 length:171 start_codon:yes stop_codon:yes gene_type:complete
MKAIDTKKWNGWFLRNWLGLLSVILLIASVFFVVKSPDRPWKNKSADNEDTNGTAQ